MNEMKSCILSNAKKAIQSLVTGRHRRHINNVDLAHGIPIATNKKYNQVYRCSDSCKLDVDQIMLTNRCEMDDIIIIYDFDEVDNQGDLELPKIVRDLDGAETLVLRKKPHCRDAQLPRNSVFDHGIYARTINPHCKGGVSVYVEGYEERVI